VAYERVRPIFYSTQERQYFLGNQVEKTEIGGECSTYGGERRRTLSFDGET
jgi:hypothetical protein